MLRPVRPDTPSINSEDNLDPDDAEVPPPEYGVIFELSFENVEMLNSRNLEAARGNEEALNGRRPEIRKFPSEIEVVVERSLNQDEELALVALAGMADAVHGGIEGCVVMFVMMRR